MLLSNFPSDDPKEDRRRPDDVASKGLRKVFGGKVDYTKVANIDYIHPAARDMLHEVSIIT